MKDNSKKSFVYYLDWAEQLMSLPDTLRLKIDDAVRRYVLYGEEPTDREVLYSMFGLMRMQIDRDVEKWNGIREKRSEAGKRHRGNQHTQRKKTEQTEQTEQMSQSGTNGTNGTDNVNVNVNVSTNVDENKPTNVGKESAFSFDVFWDVYGKKVDRKKCEKKWATLTEEQRRLAMNHAPRYIASASGRELKYRKNPLTYLNGECWNDEIIDDLTEQAEGAPFIDDKHKFDNETGW